MTKGMIRKMIITMAALAVMILIAVPVSAATTQFTSVDIQKASVTVKAGAQQSLAYSYGYRGNQPSSTTVKNSTAWTSSNSSVATVKNGVVTAKKAGTVRITAKLAGQTDSCTVKVQAAPAKFVSAAGCYTQLNNYRKGARVGSLKRDANLENIAKIRAKEMAEKNKFSHTRPNGKSGLTLIKGNVYKGENIAMGQKTCAQVSSAWFKSPGHKKNMIKKQYKKVGIAAYQYNGVIYWAQVFSS